jgi:putative transposase
MASNEMPWPHAPVHQLGTTGTFFVTASTLHHIHHFQGKKRLAVLHRSVVTVAAKFGWRLEAWAVFSNHYHFVAHSPDSEENAVSLRRMLSLLHEKTAKWLNRVEETPRRQVWFNFRETKLTYEKSYLARLNYTHQNAVKHGLVAMANQYPWCSARWFEKVARPAQVNMIYGLKVDRLSVPDDFDVSPDW